MNERIINRGPDGGGYWVDENSAIVLGHRRLSIIDLSEAGAQPLFSHDERYVIVYNGEIYNAAELKERLEAESSQIKWRGHSDTEILIEAIAAWGMEETLKLCRGMWALALYDRKTGRTQLARDRMGEKPLYYGRVNGQLVFGSSIASIAAIEGFNNHIFKDVLDVFLQYGYIPSPYTIYEDVFKLEPGSILTIDKPYTDWKIEKYFDIKQMAIDGQDYFFKGSEEEANEELERLLKKALKGQMLSDVPLGAFLSGGIDSTLVVSLMQSMSDKPIRTFTIGFEEEKYNEAKFAKETADYLGTAHKELYVGYKDVMDLLPQLPDVFGEPFADSSQLPTLLVSKMTRENVTVALSGDGGDEFFCGYNTYKDAIAGIEVMKNKLGFMHNSLRTSIGKTLLNSPIAGNSLVRKTGRVLSVKTVEDFYRMVNDDDIRTHRLVPGYNPLATKVSQYQDKLLPFGENNLMLMDMLQYLPDDILTKVDRSGMHFSLETRIPILDADVMEFAWTLPIDYKMADDITKKPLRNILDKYLPHGMMDRPKKGFSVPVGRWLKDGQMREWAESIISDAHFYAGEYLDVNLIDQIWSEYMNGGDWSKLIWHILMLEQWMISVRA